MPCYKDTTRNTWYTKFSYTDWTGQRRQKLKRGFSTKREAVAWERDFLERQQGTPEMTFQALHDLYMEDVRQHLKESTANTRESRFKHNILPYFRDKPVNEIKPSDIRKWQGIMTGKGYSPTYLKTLNDQLTMTFQFAKKFHGLKVNPCTAAGSIGKAKSGRMDFWTQTDFDRFIGTVKSPECRLAFSMLFYTGLRFGELMALNPKTDIDLERGILSVSKTYRKEHGREITTSPKTENSYRTITLPDFLVEQIREFMSRIYDVNSQDRLFLFTRSKLRLAMERGCNQTGVKRIRLHDLRHSHVSLLIEMGFQPLLIAERIGDTVEMVNNIYGHLYPNKHRDVADALGKMYQKSIT